ncbi:hypothetical protein U5B43_01720 [Campylobacter sp. 9BO]|uniref:hypothetical protein n=1 Tax=Campylobacter sp. 9BO TaxID=3424759 RepID=UPI003D34BAA5
MSKKYQIGDVFALKMQRINLYVPVQIVRVDEQDASICTAVVLDRFGCGLPTLNDVKNAKPLRQTHHFWKGEILYICENFCDLGVEFVGNFKAFKDDNKPNISETEQIQMQYEWQQLDAQIQKNFKTAKQHKAILNELQGAEYFQNLTQNSPFVYEVLSEFFFDELLKYLQNNHFVTHLQIISVKNPKLIDVSRTNIKDLSIDVSNVEKLVLNSKINRLVLNGNFSTLKEIYCPFGGKFLDLQLNLSSNEICFKGPENVQGLSVFSSQKHSIDTKNIAECLPNVTRVLINGQNATLLNVLKLADFKWLRSLWLFNCYGFCEFVKRDQMPFLQNLLLQGVPKAVGEIAKKEFGKIGEFSAKQLRSDEWIKANLANPFACWDEQDGIPKSIAKKAMNAYKSCHGALAKASSSDQKCEILSEFLREFNTINKKYDFDTMQCEEIFYAFLELAKTAGISQSDAESLFENSIDF